MKGMSHDLNHFIIGSISKIGQTFFILISVFLFINSIQGQQINRKSKIEIDIGLTDFGRFFDFNDVDGNYQLSVV